MHKQSLLRMEWFLNNICDPDIRTCLDVGSYDVNGTYRPLIESRGIKYTGLDIAHGPNVDIALPSPYDWSEIHADSYDLVISGQALEHTEFFWLTMADMARVCKKGGLIVVIVPNECRQHRYPVDCYRFFTDGMIALARWCNLEVIHADHAKGPSQWRVGNRQEDAMLIARKPYSGRPWHIDQDYKLDIPDHDNLDQTK